MLQLNDKDRVRVLSAVSRKGAPFRTILVLAITGSLLILLAVPLSGLLRIDLWGGNHILLWKPVNFIDALKGFIVIVSALYGITFLSNVVVGRFFCGWGCPVGYVSRLGEAVDRSAKNRKRHLLNHLLGAAFVFTFVGAIMLWWVDPRVLLEGSITARAITLAVFAIFGFGGFLHAFVWRFGFCVKVCPIGIYYRYVTSEAPVSILFREVPNPCTECGSCVKICPVDLDPRNLGTPLLILEEGGDSKERYGDAECIRCGDCVEACRMIFTKRKDEVPPLRFGRTSGRADGSDGGGGDSV